ncbi:MAG: hypothetical protein JWM93_884 [Frankiales bacterium]|nr:hypothetical protein [Frankiales bacterium]
MSLPYQKGSHGPEILVWQEWAYANYPLYAGLIGGKDSYYGNGEAAFTTEMQRRLGFPQTGVFDEQTANRVGYKGVTPRPHRKIWIYTAPGSGADWWLGPSFDLGERCKNVLNLNHQPLAFQKGGYLGFMGGDPGFSYNEVTYDQMKSLEYNLDHCPDINDPDVELWFSGYSQSADGMEDALEVLFGDGGFIHPGDPTQTPSPPGKYLHLRSRINGLVQFGNPSTKNTGIANKIRPPWLAALIRNINYPNDFYAVAPDEIRRDFYHIIVEADMSMPFFVHVLKVAVPVMLNFVPIFGGLLGPLAVPMVAAMTGLSGSMSLLGGLMGQAGSAGDEDVDRKLVDMLSVTGIVKNIPGLIGLIAALPGLQAHGGYPFDPVMMDRAYNVIAGFRR